MISGLSHITLIVSDLDRMTEILETIFDARLIYDSGDATFSVSKECFFDIGGTWVVIMEGSPLSDRSYNHIAFKIGEADFDDYHRRIEDAGLDLRPPRPRVEGEGRSMYFYGPDNHLFELHTGTLETRLQRYAQKLEEVT